MSDSPGLDAADGFRPLLGEVFSLQHDGQRLELVLADVEEGPEQPGAPRARPFTVTFTGTPGAPLPQGTHLLERPDQPAVALFLVPRSPAADGLSRYDATFN